MCRVLRLGMLQSSLLFTYDALGAENIKWDVPERRLITKGDLDSKSGKRHVVFFNDLLLVTKQKGCVLRRVLAATSNPNSRD